MALRIIAKRWNNSQDQVIIALKIEGKGDFQMIDVWNFISEGKGECYTFERGIRANVYARKRREGTEYQSYRIALPKAIIESKKWEDIEFELEDKGDKLILKPIKTKK
jgi:hypothetical protein